MMEITKYQVELLEKVATRLLRAINNAKDVVEDDQVGEAMKEAQHLANIIMLILELPYKPC